MELTSGLVFEKKWKIMVHCHLREKYCLPQKAIKRALPIQLAYKTKSCIQVENICHSGTKCFSSSVVLHWLDRLFLSLSIFIGSHD